MKTTITILLGGLGLLTFSATAWGQGHCASFTATGTGTFYLPGPAPAPLSNPLVPNGGWVEDVWVTIDGATQHAKAVFDAADDVWKKPPEGQNTAIGSEKGKFIFDDGSTVEMPGHFVSTLMAVSPGVFLLNEAGTTRPKRRK